jgi:glycosyltransferase involved in cell wall biosynthesis
MELSKQCYNKPVEIIYLGDNLSSSVGDKRNKALQASKGEYVCFIDDDDMVNINYVSKLLEAIEHNPDVITFRVHEEYNGDHIRYQYFEKIGRRVLDPTLRKKVGMPVITMPPNHLCCWKRKKALSIPFPDKSKGEDHVWAENMLLHNQDLDIHEIGEVLYYYRYKTSVSRTQTR